MGGGVNGILYDPLRKYTKSEELDKSAALQLSPKFEEEDDGTKEDIALTEYHRDHKISRLRGGGSNKKMRNRKL